MNILDENVPESQRRLLRRVVQAMPAGLVFWRIHEEQEGHLAWE